MTVLVINAGSSSLKFTLYDMGNEKMLASGQVERLGSDSPNMIYKPYNGAKTENIVDVKDHTEALKVICDQLTNPETGVIEKPEDVNAIGHRVVHGGEEMTKPVLIDENVKKVIRDCFSLAPLHNPPNMAGIEASESFFPGAPNIAVFDTAFHQTMEPDAYLYAVPTELYEKHGVRRYGFHGTSHHYVAITTAETLGKSLEEVNLITCHLGNGCSMAAIEKGKVKDTTMGMTPLEGLVMGTRCGDIDPAIVLMLTEKMSTTEVDKVLNKQSGLLGVGGIGSSDMRDIIDAAAEDKGNAKCALQMFVRRVVKYIGAYYTLIGGADAVVFTGGIGEYSAPVRKKVTEQLSALGIKLDEEANKACFGTAGTISTEDSTCKAIVTPTNEELMIARYVTKVMK